MVEESIAAMDELAIHHATRRFAALRLEDTVEQALASIRCQPIDSAIVYFYVVDEHSRLHGAVPTRRLLTATPDAPVSALMTDAPVTLPLSATMRDAAMALVAHRLLAIPLVGLLGRMHGVIDASTLGAEISANVSGHRRDELFDLIGVHLGDRGTHRFQSRFLSLLWNVGGGLVAAFVAGVHEQLLSTVAALAVFMPVTLAVSESIGMQALAVTLERQIQARGAASSHPVLESIAQESRVAFRLALICAALVAGVAAVWHQDWRFTVTVLVAITVAMSVAAVLGTAIPRFLHRLRQNPTIASGPAVLAITDFICLVVYFRIAAALLD